MITLEEAIEIYLKKTKAKYLAWIYETESSYRFSYVSEEGSIPTDCGLAVKKDTGEVWVMFPFRHIDEWRGSKEIEVPEKYRYPGEIIDD